MIGSIKGFLPPLYKRVVKRFVKTSWQSTLYLFGHNFSRIGSVHSIIFVCKGNICRSAFAEHYLKTLHLNENLKIDSCGLDVDQGVFSPQDAIRAAAELGIDLCTNRSKGLSACDLENADLIIPMEYDHFKRLIHKFPQKKKEIILLRDFAPWPESLACNIHDPYGYGIEAFRSCFKAMQRALDGLAVQLKKGRKR